jgi:hypothetical protein
MYFDMNGDLMRDPEFRFLIVRGKLKPREFRSDTVPRCMSRLILYKEHASVGELGEFVSWEAGRKVARSHGILQLLSKMDTLIGNEYGHMLLGGIAQPD